MTVTLLRPVACTFSSLPKVFHAVVWVSLKTELYFCLWTTYKLFDSSGFFSSEYADPGDKGHNETFTCFEKFYNIFVHNVFGEMLFKA